MMLYRRQVLLTLMMRTKLLACMMIPKCRSWLRASFVRLSKKSPRRPCRTTLKQKDLIARVPSLLP